MTVFDDLPPDLPAGAIVDAHVHFWICDARRYRWIGEAQRAGAPLPSRYLPADHLTAFAGLPLRGMVHVEADRDNSRPWRETRWASAMARRIGRPFAIVAHADLTAPDLPAVLARHRRAGPLRGVRMRLAASPRDLLRRRVEETALADRRFQTGLARLGEAGLSVEMQATPNLVPAVCDLAARHPSVPVVLSHFAFPFDRSAAGLRDWRRALATATGVGNVHLKLSGLRMVDPTMPDGLVGDLVRCAAENFGADRLIFGSNFPVEFARCRPDRALGGLVGPILALGPSAAANILARNAERLYRLAQTRSDL